MKNHWQILVFTIQLAGGQFARAEIIVDHQPEPYGGLSADTDFVTDAGQPGYWQLLADDFLIPNAASFRHIIWWGFYGGQDLGTPLPPTGDETLRLRIHSARSSDGLPGTVLREENILNPSRAWTGRYVLDSYGHKEYRFEADVAAPITIDGGRVYWLEIVQFGIPDSHYRWEQSTSDNRSSVYLNPTAPDWQLYAPGRDCAFQLSSVPEPSALALSILVFLVTAQTGISGTRRKSCVHTH